MWTDLYLESLHGTTKSSYRKEIIYNRETDQHQVLKLYPLMTGQPIFKNIPETISNQRVKIYDREVGFMVWNKSHGLDLIDGVSRYPLDHIYFVCHDLICFKLMGYSGEDDSDISDFNFANLMGANMGHNMLSGVDGLSGYAVYSGSKAERVDLQLSIVEKDKSFPGNCKVIKNSDQDVMATFEEYVIAFEGDERANILATIETEHCRPGYLRLVHVENEALERFRYPGSRRVLNGKKYFTKHLFERVLSAYERVNTNIPLESVVRCNGISYYTHVKMHMNNLKGPSICLQQAVLLKPDPGYSRGATYVLYESDCVFAFRCLTWPPIASEWISRERVSGWPSQKTIAKIVSDGCHVVAVSHDFSEEKDIEFRFSFSVAEVSLFHDMSPEQRQCYASFKAIVGKCLKIMNTNHSADINLKSYHMKTVFPVDV